MFLHNLPQQVQSPEAHPGEEGGESEKSVKTSETVLLHKRDSVQVFIWEPLWPSTLVVGTFLSMLNLRP